MVVLCLLICLLGEILILALVFFVDIRVGLFIIGLY